MGGIEEEETEELREESNLRGELRKVTRVGITPLQKPEAPE